MSQENVEIVRRMYDAFYRGEFEEALGYFHPDVLVDASAARPDSLAGRGREQVRRTVATWVAAWDGWREEIEEVRDLSSQVLVLSVQRGRGRGSRVEVEAHYALLYDLDGSEITRMRLYGSLPEALEAGAVGAGDVAGEHREHAPEPPRLQSRRQAAWLAMFDPDAEMVPAPEWPEREPIRGAEAIWDFYVEVTGTWAEGLGELGEVIEAGADKIVANNRRDARGRTSGAGVEFSYWTVITYRNGKVVRMEWFADRAQALDAVGLSE